MVEINIGLLIVAILLLIIFSMGLSSGHKTTYPVFYSFMGSLLAGIVLFSMGLKKYNIAKSQ
jgi:hypothetical protein